MAAQAFAKVVALPRRAGPAKNELEEEFDPGSPTMGYQGCREAAFVNPEEAYLQKKKIKEILYSSDWLGNAP